MPVEFRVLPGWKNQVRWFIRTRVTFSTYVRFIAPWIGWPRTARVLVEDP